MDVQDTISDNIPLPHGKKQMIPLDTLEKGIDSIALHEIQKFLLKAQSKFDQDNLSPVWKISHFPHDPAWRITLY
eukprot:15356559-Ditylum_brightwellii.AAC.1